MNQKHLVFVLSAMTISFILILGMMLVFTDTGSQPSLLGDRKVLTQDKLNLVRQIQNDHIHRQKPISIKSNSENKPKSNQIKTSQNQKFSQATLDEFSSLKNELRQEIGTLQSNRSVMITDLAKILSTLRPDQIADELSTFDKKTIHFILSRYNPDLQKAIQVEITNRNKN